MGEAEASGEETHHRCALAMGLKLDVWVSAEALRTKQGMRKTRVSLPEVTHFGVRRRPDGAATLTELRLVTKDGKVHKVPYSPADDGARQVLARLKLLRPDADVSDMLWTEAAPLLGIKPFGMRDFFVQPFTMGGVAMLVGSPVAVQVIKLMQPDMAPQQAQTYTIAMALCMAGGAVAMFIGWRKMKKSQAQEEGAMARKQGAPPETGA